ETLQPIGEPPPLLPLPPVPLPPVPVPPPEPPPSPLPVDPCAMSGGIAMSGGGIVTVTVPSTLRGLLALPLAVTLQATPPGAVAAGPLTASGVVPPDIPAAGENGRVRPPVDFPASVSACAVLPDGTVVATMNVAVPPAGAIAVDGDSAIVKSLTCA